MALNHHFCRSDRFHLLERIFILSPYFNACLTFMVVLMIAGVGLDAFDSTKGIVGVVIGSLGAAVLVYFLSKKA